MGAEISATKNICIIDEEKKNHYGKQCPGMSMKEP